MSWIWKIVLIGSILVNLLAVWGYFSYVKYGGNPLGDLKRKLTGGDKVGPPRTPWAEESAAIRKEIAEGKTDPLRVVFFGASITNRWDLKTTFPEIHAINRGMGGQLAPQFLPRFKRDVIDLKPRAVMIKFCSINMRPEMSQQSLKDAMDMLCQLATANGIIAIPATIIPAGKAEARISDYSVVDSLREFNDWLRQYASDKQLPLIDFARSIDDENGFLPRECAVDPVHVNERGYEILAEAARPVLHRVLGLSSQPSIQ